MFTREGERRRRAGGVGLGEVLSPSRSFGKSAPRTGARAVGFRWRGDFEFGPDGLARIRSRGGPPAVGEGVDEGETSAGLGVGGEALDLREAVTPSVGDFDAEGVADDVEGESEVPAGDTAVGGGVGGELGHDVLRRVQREAPGAELLGGEESGEADSSGRW
jgi:hypothetical protein